jgi:hypothetical protein
LKSGAKIRPIDDGNRRSPAKEIKPDDFSDVVPIFAAVKS